MNISYQRKTGEVLYGFDDGPPLCAAYGVSDELELAARRGGSFDNFRRPGQPLLETRKGSRKY